jgi:hypothetical protein
MSLICRVVIGYFDAHAACAQRAIAPTRPVDEEDVACLQAACGEAFGIKLGLSNHLTRDAVLCIEDVRVRRDTYKAAAVAQGLFGMSAVDHAHRCVLFPAEEEPLPERDQFLRFYESLRLDLNEQRRQQRAEEYLRPVREEREFRRGLQDWGRSFAAAWRSRADRSWLTPNVIALARTASEERRFDVLPILAGALEEAGCTDPGVLDHLRRPARHVRGCWAVDPVLAKE